MKVRILQSGIHAGEEGLVVGNDRSGMVVFSGCHLACSFCYTPETSVLRLGKDFTSEEFLEVLTGLLARGAKNINLISPTQVWSGIESALHRFKQGPGKRIPLVLKFSGFESPGLIDRFCKVADVLVPDFKVFDPGLAASVNLPPHYGRVASDAFSTMLRSHGVSVEEGGILHRGVLARHLLMPGFETDSLAIVRQLARLGFQGPLNLMTCFVSPKGGLRRAPKLQVQNLAQQARELGIAVLIDGQVQSDRDLHCENSGRASA